MREFGIGVHCSSFKFGYGEYGVARICRLPNFPGLFWKRALHKQVSFPEETESTGCSHPIGDELLCLFWKRALFW